MPPQQASDERQSPFFASLYAIVIIVAVLIPPLGLVLSVIGYYASKSKTNKELAKTAGTIGGILTILIVLLITWITIVSNQEAERGKRLPNVASEKIEPLIRAIKQSGAETICETGYDGVSGLNIDGVPPDYTGYFRMKNPQDIAAIIDTYNTSAAIKLKAPESIETITETVGPTGTQITRTLPSDAPTADLHYSNEPSEGDGINNDLSVMDIRHRSVKTGECGDYQMLKASPEYPIVSVGFIFWEFRRS